LATILPLILLPYYGLAGAAAAFFIGCLSHALILFFVVRLRSGSWLSSNILGWGALSATLLVMAQLSVAPFEGEYWGAIPTALIAVFCVIVYYRLAKDKN
jgi:O-antigen/teichoic acid export membrane protein